MGFRLVQKSMTLNDLERRNGHVVCVISPNSVAQRHSLSDAGMDGDDFWYELLGKSGWRYTDTFCKSNVAWRI